MVREINKMAKEKKSIAESLKNDKGEVYDWRNLGYAEVAGQYLKQLGQEGIPYAKKSLEIILKDCEINDPWIVKTVSDPAVLGKSIQNQLDTYNQCMEEQTVGELMDYHRKDLEAYLGENMPKAEKGLNSFANENYGEIMKKIAKAKYIIEGKKHNVSSDKDVENAEKTVKKYEKLTNTIEILKQKKTSYFRNRVDDGVMGEALNEMHVPTKEISDGAADDYNYAAAA